MHDFFYLLVHDATELGKELVFQFKVNWILSGGGEDRYSFDYTVELTGGKKKKSYQILVGEGQVLVNGSVVKQERLFCPGIEKGVLVHGDQALTGSSQNLNLSQTFKKKPFAPSVD